MLKRNLEVRNELIDSMEQIVELADSEMRPLTEEEIKQIEELKEKLVGVDKSIETEKSVEDLKAPVKEEVKEEKIKEDAKEVAPEGEKDMENRSLEVRAVEEGFFEALKTRAITGAGNLPMIPTTISKDVVTKVVAESAILDQATIYNVTGLLNIPVLSTDLTGVCKYQDEMANAASEDLTFGNKQLKAFIMSAMVTISKQLINATDFDIRGFVVETLAKSIRIGLEREVLVGTPNKIVGLSATENVITVANKDAITIDEVMSASNACLCAPEEQLFIVNRAFYGKVKSLKDASGHFYVTPGFDATQAPVERLLGMKIAVSDLLLDSADHVGFVVNPKALAVKFGQQVEVQELREMGALRHAVMVLADVEVDAVLTNDELCVGIKNVAARSK